jgi:hypothetical protein
MAQAVRMLTRAMRYRMPMQDLGVPLNHAPTGPEEGMILSHIEPVDS